MRQNRIMTILAIAGVSFSALALTAPAQAAPAADEAELQYVLDLNDRYLGASAEEIAARLSEDDMALLRHYGQAADVAITTTVEQVDPTDPSVAAAAAELGQSAELACYNARATHTGRSAAQIDLYRIWTTGGWCVSGTVTSASVLDSGAQTLFLGWSHLGKKQQDAGVVSGQGRSYTQHHLQYWLGTPQPTQNVYPCARVRGNALGGAYTDNLCGIYA